jgi:hypothetical protein
VTPLRTKDAASQVRIQTWMVDRTLVFRMYDPCSYVQEGLGCAIASGNGTELRAEAGVTVPSGHVCMWPVVLLGDCSRRTLYCSL